MSQTTTDETRALHLIEELGSASYDVTPGERGGDPTECDVIMKGGITSGVVYPLTICKLATRYRLRSIGGTSAGAIAAVLAAAAEHRRHVDPQAPAAGFQALARVPLDVSERLASLFQPPARTRRVFEVLLAAVGPRPLRTTLAAVVRQQLGWFLGGVALVLVTALPAPLLSRPDDGLGPVDVVVGLVLPLLLGLVVGLVAAVAAFVRAALRVLPQEDFGLTDGATHSGDERQPGLTDWLTAEIDRVAGVERCLTLGDLWGDDGLSAWREHVAAPEKRQGPLGPVRRRRRVDLQTMTTDLTLRRPFSLPFSQQVFLFDEVEMRDLFPDRVVDAMTDGHEPSEHRSPLSGRRLHYFPGPGSTGDRARPGPEALPLVVMARMSLSFPGLISAVPLYAVDRNGDGAVVRHLFSDGGISSNFPMHFFDALLPTRPTFGINLAPPHPSYPDEMTWLPEPAGGGVIPRAIPFGSVPGFAGALRDTVQNWSDNTQVTQRGYAERVVEIRLRADEGGLNLRMRREVILALVARGAEAGDQLLDFAWDPHRVIRYRIAMSRLTEALEGLDAAWAGRDYPALLAGYPFEGAPASSYVDGVAWRADDLAATGRLLEVVERWRQDGWPALREERPSPAPRIRMTPE